MNEVRSVFHWKARTFESYKPPNRLNRGLIVMAPWLDAAVLLLFFLLITSRFVLQPGIRIRLPEAPFRDGAGPYDGLVAVVVAREAAGGDGDVREVLYFDDERFVLAQPAHLAKLQEAWARAARQRPGQAMILEADRLTRHGTVVMLLNAAAEAGIAEVMVATRPPGGEQP